MGDIRDPLRDQPLPKPGGLPVQDAMILAIRERREYGIRKYGRPLETNNGRDALADAWEEALDLLSYLTQARLERGDVLPGMEQLDEMEKLLGVLEVRTEQDEHERRAAVVASVQANGDVNRQVTENLRSMIRPEG
jgi:hypothetical protein